MKRKVEKVGEGWTVLDGEGRLLQELDDMWFVADLKHGLALFSGFPESMRETFDRLRLGCSRLGAMGEFEQHVRIAKLGSDVDEVEASYMLSTLRLPRRVQMRLR